jgi:hypothetical protein
MTFHHMESTRMQATTPNHADLLTQQGIAALQANDKARAHEMLGRAVQIEPHHEQAWLWLSGAVATDAERRYCLEQVLVINPRNSAAQRGMALLPAALPVSPIREDPPARPEPPSALDSIDTPAPASASAPLGVVAATAIVAGSLLDLIDQSEPVTPTTISPSVELKSRFFSDTAEPPVVTFAPPPVANLPGDAAQPTTAVVALMSAGHDQAVVDFVIREHGRHRSRDEIVRALSTQYRMAWDEAQELAVKVEREHRTTIARRQSPFLIFLGVATLIGGLFLAGRGIFLLYVLYFGATHGSARILNPRVVAFIVGQMFTGILMVAGSTVGLGQTIKGMFK